MAENELPPVSWASVIIGFVSFAFTLSTFFRVIAGNLSTLSSAPKEVPVYLSNLKQELFEERLHLRRARRRAERQVRHQRRLGIGLPSWDSSPAIRLLEATVRRLCKQFKELERPFLIDRPSATSSAAENNNSNQRINTLEAARENKEVWDDYMDGGFEHDYGSVTFYHRFAWLRRKTQLQQLAASLERLQVRRIGRETTDALNEIKRVRGDLVDLKLVPGDDSYYSEQQQQQHHGGGGGHGHGHGHGGGGGGRAYSGLSSGTRRRRSQARGRTGTGGGGGNGGGTGRPASISTSSSSESSDEGIANEKTQRVHIRRTSRYRIQ